MPSSMPRNPELEAAAFADTTNHDAWRVYADWLQAQGDARGELILLSLHEGGAFLSEKRAYETRRKANEAAMTREWKDWARKVGAGTNSEFGFSRGLLEQVSGSLANLAPHLDALFEMAPVHKLVLSHCKPADLLALFGRRPAWLGRLSYLKFEASPKIDAKCLNALASNPLPELDGINLTACAIDRSCCAALAGLQSHKLRRVVLTANAIDDEALPSLLAAEHRTQWRKLYLTGNPLGDEGLATLAHDPGLAELEQLYLRQIEAEFTDLAVFADRKALPGLRVLEVEAGWNADRPTKKALQARFGKGLRGV
ncbi:hypothetical protein ACNOYE_39465 [Nannocystaceae bacterium ST9]